MNRLSLLLIPVVAFGFVGCGSAEEEENQEEEARYERPEEARSIVTDAQLDEMVEIGATIYSGSTPPELEGVYDRDEGSVVDADREAAVGQEACSSIWTVEATDVEYRYSSMSEQYGGGICEGTSEVPATYIAGSDDCFSLFMEHDGERDGCNFRWAQVVSGCVDEDGINDYQEVDLGLEADDSTACDDLIEGGSIPGVGERALVEYSSVTRQVE